MTKDKKSNQKGGPVKGAQAEISKTKAQSEVGSVPSVRLLTKIEIKGSGSQQNILVPAPVAQTVQGFMGSMETKFNREYKFEQVLIDSQNGQFKVENQYTIGQCFKDFDNIIVKGSKVAAKSTEKVDVSKSQEKVVDKKSQKTQEKVVANKSQKTEEKQTPKKAKNEVIIAETKGK